MSQLSAHQLHLSYSSRTVLDGLDVVAGAGERLGLVGENGTGKSTLLRLLAGVEAPDSGTVVRHGSLGFLSQEPDLPAGSTVGAAVDAALAEFRGMEARMRELEAQMAAGAQADLDEYGELLERFDARDGWGADARAARALAGLGLGELDPDRSTDEMSGGQRSRLALALALVRAPEILLLDEPTNHLDDDALGYLESALTGHRGVLVAASHDRAFLDAVCTSILDLDPALRMDADGRPVIGPARYSGAYTDYLVGKAAAQVRWEQAHAAWNDAADEARAAIRTDARQVGHGGRAPRDNDKFVKNFLAEKVDGAVARRVRDAQLRLLRLEERRVIKPPRPLRFAGSLGESAPAVGDGVLIAAREVVVPGRISVPALDVTGATRVVVTGANGSGKSSLLAVLAGALAPTSGRVMIARGVRIGWLPQTGTFPDPSATALAAFAAGRPGPPEDHQGDLVSLGLLGGRDLQTPVGRLSVGQQRRLALARLMTSDPQVLLLDEPTNHLSLRLVDELEDAMASSGLAVVVVSHDRWLRRRWDAEWAEVVDGALRVDATSRQR